MAMPKIILAATDFSAAGDHAVDYALELGAALGATVHLLHVYAPPVSPEAADVAVLASGKVENSALDSLGRLVAPHADKIPHGELLVMIGDPRAEIVHTAERLACDLIVLGTHGRRGFKRMVLGSVAEMVVRTARCPVLTVHPPEAGA